MSRKQPKNSVPPPIQKWSDKEQRTIGGTDIIVQTRTYKLITPLFGGGVEPGVNDPVTLIRATEIRGQLRFWWRAICGWQFGDNWKKMKEREDEIWGAASSTSKAEEREREKKWKEAVQIIVEIVEKGKLIEPFQVVDKRGQRKLDSKRNDLKPDFDTFPFYAAFPLQPSRDELNKAKKKEDVILKKILKDTVFTLTISFPKKWANEIYAAIWAWETFGGVGARTRRGFGAVYLDKAHEEGLPPAHSDEAEQWIRKKLAGFLETEQKKQPANIPHLDPTMKMCLLGPFSSASDAWNKLVDTLNKFRQQRRSRQGKSLWPEASALRNRLHPNQQPAQTLDKFPRAAFGLPIVFHMAHEHPAETITLQGKDGSERWASRLILKPIPCQGKQFLGLAILLNGPDLPDEELALLREGEPWKKISREQTKLSPEEIPALLNEILDREADVLKAFMNYLKKEGE